MNVASSSSHDARVDVSLPITIQSAKLEEANRRVNEVSMTTDAAKVVIPEWRSKSYTVSYRLEGIEVGTSDSHVSTIHCFTSCLISRFNRI